MINISIPIHSFSSLCALPNPFYLKIFPIFLHWCCRRGKNELFYTLSASQNPTYALADSELGLVGTLVSRNIYKKNTFDILTHVGKKRQKLIKLYSIRPTDSPLQLDIFETFTIGDSNFTQYIPEQYLRFSYKDVREVRDIH